MSEVSVMRAPLGSLAEIDRGISWDISQERSGPSAESMPVLRIPNIKSTLAIDDLLYLKTPDLNSVRRWIARPGSIIMVGSNGNASRVGNVAFIEGDREFLFASFLFGIHPSSQLNPRYLYHYLASPRVQDGITRSVQGTTGLKNLSKAYIKNLFISVPSLPEQCRIAEILDAVDKTIRSTEQLIAKLDEAKAGVLNDLVTRGIDESGRLRDPMRHPDQFVRDHIEPLPKEWRQVPIGQILTPPESFIQTGPFGSQLHANEYTAEGTPVVMPQDIDPGGISTSRIARINSTKAAQLNRHRMQAGDVVFARRGDLSKCAAITSGQEGWLCGTGCLLLRPPTSLSSGWLAALYRHAICQRQIAATAVGTTMVNLNTKLVSNLQIPLPSIREQQRITKVISAEETNIIQAKGEVEKFRLLKQGLMDDLLTGRVLVGDSR